MVVLYALGGGLGHLTRARRVLAALGVSDDAVLLTASRYAHDPRVTGEVPVLDVPSHLGTDRAAFRRWLTGTLRDLDPDELIVDTFPGGILGELCGMELPPARLIARRLRWPAYRRRLSGEMPTYEIAHVIEPLAALHADAIASCARSTAPMRLAPAAAPSGAPLHDEPHVAVVHSGSGDELDELIELARELRSASSTRVLVVAPRPPRRLSGDVIWRDTYPVAPHLGHAEAVVTAAGWAAMHDTEPVRDRHRFVPFPRALDDQYARARLARLRTRDLASPTRAGRL